jgi:hypothetical protein
MMTREKRRRFIVVLVFIFGMVFWSVTFLRDVPPLLFRTFIKSLTPPPPLPEEIFEQHVLSPIPKSVTNIKADQPSKIFGSIYTFRFNINRDNLDLFINSRPFVEVWHVKYKNGMLEWGLGHAGPIELNIAKYAHSTPLYGDVWDLPREPVWFKLGLWDNPEAYAFYKVGDLVNIQAFERDGRNLGGRVTMQVLLYNEKEGEAYFIVSSRENK